MSLVSTVSAVAATADAPVRIGNVAVPGDLILAPMAGYSDVPFRTICREMGSAISYTPCALDTGILHKDPRTNEAIDFLPSERPVAIQVIGRDVDQILNACLRVLPLQPDLIDVNMGCPARRVVNGGRGAALLQEPERARRIMATLSAAMPVPVTAKIRLGWDRDSLNYLEMAQALEAAGAAAIAVHGRTGVQRYSGQADWEAIARVCEAVRVPVIANGDVRTPEDIAAIRAATGCRLVMIGRGAVGHPWAFQGRHPRDVPMPERTAVMRRHLTAMRAYYGERVALLLFRKHAVRYVNHLDGVAAWRRAFGMADSRERYEELFDRLEAGAWPD